MAAAVSQNLEEEVDIETKKCMDLARAKARLDPRDPSKSIDHFIFCLTNQLKQVPFFKPKIKRPKNDCCPLTGKTLNILLHIT